VTEQIRLARPELGEREEELVLSVLRSGRDTATVEVPGGAAA